MTELFSHYKCDKNGNYLPLQCSESVCYAVDGTYGYQISESVLKTDKTKITELIKNYHKYPNPEKYPEPEKYPDPNKYPEPDKIFRIYKYELL